MDRELEPFLTWYCVIPTHPRVTCLRVYLTPFCSCPNSFINAMKKSQSSARYAARHKLGRMMAERMNRTTRILCNLGALGCRNCQTKKIQWVLTSFHPNSNGTDWTNSTSPYALREFRSTPRSPRCRNPTPLLPPLSPTSNELAQTPPTLRVSKERN